MPPITPRGRFSSSFVKKLAGVSSSSREGIGGRSGLTGVADPPTPGEPCRGIAGSEFCLNRCEMLKMSPKLFLPLVDVEVRVEDPKYGTGDRSSWSSASDPIVDDLPRPPLWEGLDRTERVEFVELLRNNGGALDAGSTTEERDGEGRGEI